jgi:putative ABC transport system permease protein
VTRHLLKLVWKRKRANALLIIEILCSFVVLFAVIMLGSAMVMRYQRPLGFDYHDVWSIRVEIPDPSGAAEAAHEVEYRKTIGRMMNELRSIPGIESVGASMSPVYSMGGWTSSGEINGRSVDIDRDAVSDDYAKVMRMPLVRGRWFSEEDEGARVTPVVVDRDVATLMFGSDDPIGKVTELSNNESVRVVGVVEPYRRKGEYSKDHMNVVFLRSSMISGDTPLPRNIFIRVRPGTPAELEETINERLHAIDRDLTIRVQHLDQIRERTNKVMIVPVIAGSVLGLFLVGMVALGLSGVLWQNVTRRTRELGLRRALGATSSEVHRQILVEVALLASLAIVLGVILIAQLPLIGIFNFVTPLAFTIGLAGALAAIYAITLACGLYPSVLASRVTPADALRWE